jgi:ubiquitin conjugation factor E4 B
LQKRRTHHGGLNYVGRGKGIHYGYERSDHHTDGSQIRAKRLAKLGGPASAGTTQSPTPTGSSNTTPLEQSAAPSPPPAQASALTDSATNAPASSEQAQNTTTRQIKVQPRTASPAKRERDGSQRPKPAVEKAPESLENWQDKMLRQVFRVTLKPEEVRDVHGHHLIHLASTRDDLEEQSAPLQLNVEVVEAAITEAASKAPGGKPFKYLLASFKLHPRRDQAAMHELLCFRNNNAGNVWRQRTRWKSAG